MRESMQKEKNATGRDPDRELDALDQQIAALEAEKAGLPPVPGWDELQDSNVIQEMEQREARRGILPLLINSAKVKKLELQLSRQERELKPLQQRRERAYETMERAREEKIRAEEALGKATGEWSDANIRAQSYETRIRHLNRELNELKGVHNG
jgi:DNA repair exonuclease SbcCD ATPase subunit